MVDNIEEPNEQIEEQDNFADDSQDPPIEDATRYIVKVSVATHTLLRGSGLKGGFYWYNFTTSQKMGGGGADEKPQNFLSCP